MDQPVTRREWRAATDALRALVDLYVANPGGKHEFIMCLTAKHASEMTASERKRCEVWRAWDKARAVLARLPKPPDQKERA